MEGEVDIVPALVRQRGEHAADPSETDDHEARHALDHHPAGEFRSTVGPAGRTAVTMVLSTT